MLICKQCLLISSLFGDHGIIIFTLLVWFCYCIHLCGQLMVFFHILTDDLVRTTHIAFGLLNGITIYIGSFVLYIIVQ